MKTDTVRFINAGPSQVVPIDAVRLHPENPHQADVEEIAEAIKANGFHGSLLVQISTGYIVAGNHRWLALKSLGSPTAPVQFLDIDDATATRILLADNQLGRRGTESQDKVTALLRRVHEDAGTLRGTGYTDGDLNALLARVTQAPPPAPRPPDPPLPEPPPAPVPAVPSSGDTAVGFNIIFDNEAQAARWGRLLKHLKDTLPTVPTLGGRLDLFVEESLKALGAHDAAPAGGGDA